MSLSGIIHHSCSKVVGISLDIFGNVRKSSENRWKSLEVAWTFSVIPVMTRQNSHAFDSKKGWQVYTSDPVLTPQPYYPLQSPILHGIVSQPEMKCHFFTHLKPKEEILTEKICFNNFYMKTT